MADSKRDLEMERFRKGELNVLICTNALEEGVDVSDCAFVIRFNRPLLGQKSHIQGAGRARRSDAKIFYFDNDPDKEEGRAKLLSEVAKDESLRLTEAQREERRIDATLSIPGVYPFNPPESAKAEVNLYNCLQMVYEYCAKTMGQSLNPEDLFTYEEKVICEYPRQVRKFIKEAKYPSPEGFQQVTLERVNARWGDTKLDSVLDPSRSRNLKTEDKEKRRFLYVVAIDMHERGLL
ncbi:dcr-1, partial [Symbiodinium pilosum]